MSSTESGGEKSDVTNPVKRWMLLTGSRTAFAAALAIGVAALTAALAAADLVYLGPGSTVATELSSGLLSGLLTVVTVTLSINQLILSRVFGAPADLTDRLEGNLDFRRSVEEVAGVDTSPNDPGSFLALVARTLESRAAAFERVAAGADVRFEGDGEAGDGEAGSAAESEGGDGVEAYASDLVDYADHLSEAEDGESTFDVLLITLGTEYADQIDATRRLQSAHGDDLPAEARGALDDVLELLKAVATIRQFFKTLAIQQDLARLSRHLIYTGFVAVLVTFYLGQVYTGGTPAAATLPRAWLPWVVSVAAGVVFAPIAVLVTSLLRVATVTLYTVSVGSFVPPEERIQSP